MPLGTMFHFGNYNNLKCGRGGFGVWACPLKAPLVKHCTSAFARVPICVFVHALKELTYSFALRVAASDEFDFS